MKKHCESCGRQLADQAGFCDKCGKLQQIIEEPRYDPSAAPTQKGMRYLRVRRFLGLLYLALGALALVVLVVVLVVAFADMSKCLIDMEGCRLANVTRALFLGEASTTLILAVFQVSPPFWIATGILGVFLVWGKCLKHLWQVVEYLLAHIRSR